MNFSVKSARGKSEASVVLSSPGVMSPPGAATLTPLPKVSRFMLLKTHTDCRAGDDIAFCVDMVQSKVLGATLHKTPERPRHTRAQPALKIVLRLNHVQPKVCNSSLRNVTTPSLMFLRGKNVEFTCLAGGCGVQSSQSMP